MSKYYVPSVDFDEEMVLSLCNSKRKPFMEIYNIQKPNRNISFASCDEISFDVPIYRDDPYGNKVRNELFDEIKEDLFILLNEDQYFVIKECNVSKDSGEDAVKSVEAFSYEYTLSNKIVEDYNLTSRLLWDVHDNMDANGYHQGFLNYVCFKTDWHVDYVSPKVLNKRRELKYSNRSILDCIYDSAETFNCIFQFDTINRGISAYDISEIGGNQGIVISDKNFIESLTQKINTNDLKTRLYMYGENNLSFRKFNPTGKPYLDNLSFYREFGYFSDELCTAMDNYNKAIKSVEKDFENITDRLKKYDTILEALYRTREKYEMNYRKALQQVDSAISSRGSQGGSISLEPHVKAVNECKKKIEETITEIKTTVEQRNAEALKIEELTKKIEPKKFFTNSVIDEYNEFIKEDSKGDNSFVKGMETQLLDYCKEIISKIAYPVISFDVDLDSFRKISNFQNPMSRLKVGDMAYVECEELNVCAELRIISMRLNYEDHSAEISFGNRYKVNSSEMYLTELLNDLKSVSTSVSLSDFYWNRNIEQYSAISKYLDSNLNLARQAIVTAEGQKPILDDRGLWLFKQNPDGSIDNKQIRAVNNVIALTNDNWKTVTTAISGDGINAEAVTGRLGNFVTLNANQILVDSSGLNENSDLNKVFKANNEKIIADAKEQFKALDTKFLEYKVDIGNNLDVLRGVVDQTAGGIKDVKENAVLKDTFYNRVKITPTNGIQVFDDNNNERVKIGQLGYGRYGIKITSSDGHRTMLDDRGMLQTWQEGRTDNISSGYPMKLYVYIPQEAREIYRCIMRLKVEAFRAYTRGGEAGGGFYRPSANADVYIEKATAEVETWDNNQYTGHNHGLYVRNNTEPISNSQGKYIGDFQSSGNHTHDISIRIAGHTHMFSAPDHSHPMIYGVYTDYQNNPVAVSVNGYSVEYSTYSKDKIDITDKMNIGAWNEIVISSTGNTRADATIFTQVMMNL